MCKVRYIIHTMIVLVIFHKMKAYYDMWKGGQADPSEEPVAGWKILLKWAIKSRMWDVSQDTVQWTISINRVMDVRFI